MCVRCLKVWEGIFYCGTFYTDSKSEAPRTSRDEKRRAQHNEGEQWPQFLSSLLPIKESDKRNLFKTEQYFVCCFIVERRRRDKINNWIVQLSKTIPDCTLDSTKTGQVGFSLSGSSLQVTSNGAVWCHFLPCGLWQSKGGILSKACDYIQELRQSNNRLAEELNTLERLRMDNQLLRQEVSTVVFIFI